MFLSLRVSGVAARSVVTNTVPALSHFLIASITSSEPSIRSSTAVFGATAPRRRHGNPFRPKSIRSCRRLAR
jgi:hypothetical protein